MLLRDAAVDAPAPADRRRLGGERTASVSSRCDAAERLDRTATALFDLRSDDTEDAEEAEGDEESSDCCAILADTSSDTELALERREENEASSSGFCADVLITSSMDRLRDLWGDVVVRDIKRALRVDRVVRRSIVAEMGCTRKSGRMGKSSSEAGSSSEESYKSLETAIFEVKF